MDGLISTQIEILRRLGDLSSIDSEIIGRLQASILLIANMQEQLVDLKVRVERLERIKEEPGT